MKNDRTISIAVVAFAAIILAAHFTTPDVYNWTHNSIIDMAAQGNPNQWVMQLGFVSFGVLLCLGVGRRLRAQPSAKFLWLVGVYGFSILLTGFFSAAPILPSVTGSESQAWLHSLFATVAGVALSLAIVWRVLSVQGLKQKLLHSAFLVGVMGLSALYGWLENSPTPGPMGVAQRALYICGLVWLLVVERELDTATP